MIELHSFLKRSFLNRLWRVNSKLARFLSIQRPSFTEGRVIASCDSTHSCAKTRCLSMKQRSESILSTARWVSKWPISSTTTSMSALTRRWLSTTKTQRVGRKLQDGRRLNTNPNPSLYLEYLSSKSLTKVRSQRLWSNKGQYLLRIEFKEERSTTVKDWIPICM